MNSMTHELPAGFEALAPYAREWSDLDEVGVVKKRLSSSLEDLRILLVNRAKIEGFIVSDHLALWPEALKELIQLAAIQHAFDVASLHVGSVILYAAVVQDVAADLIAPGDLALFAHGLFEFFIALGLLDKFELAFQDGHRQTFVLLLAAFY